MLTNLRVIKERDAKRLLALETVEVKCRENNRKIIGVVKDFSSSGARIRVYDPASLGQKVTLTSPQFGESVSGTVRWHHGTEIGIQFDKPLP